MRSDGAADFFAGEDFTPSTRMRFLQLISGARCEKREWGDGGKGFAKSQRSDLFDISFALNLTGCMAFGLRRLMRVIPWPLSVMINRHAPPRSTDTSIRSLCASMAFSNNSFTTEAGGLQLRLRRFYLSPDLQEAI